MKKTFIAVVLFVGLAVTAGMALAATVNVPWYNETTGWDTWMIMTSDPSGAARSVTITFYSSTGAALASTTSTISNDGQPYVKKVGDFVAEDVSTAWGSLTIQEGTGNTAFDDVNILIGVQRTDTGVGFLIPVYPETIDVSTDTGTGGKYTVFD